MCLSYNARRVKLVNRNHPTLENSLNSPDIELMLTIEHFLATNVQIIYVLLNFTSTEENLLLLSNSIFSRVNSKGEKHFEVH